MLQKGVTFESAFGRAVYSAVFKQSSVEAHDFFKPGRTAFIFNLEDDHAAEFRPNVVRRSRSECENVAYVMPDSDSKVVNMLSQVIAYIQPSASGEVP